MLLAGLLHASKANQRLPTGFFLRHSATHVFLHCQINVRSHLVIQFVIERIFVEKRTKAVKRPSE
jgi:N6-adenosine-specific RNA methylase IME4